MMAETLCLMAIKRFYTKDWGKGKIKEAFKLKIL